MEASRAQATEGQGPSSVSAARSQSTLQFWRMLVHSPSGRQLTLLGLAGMAGLFSRTTLGPLQEMLARDLRLGDAEVAALQGPALALPLLVLAIPLGLLIDRTTRARLLLIVLALNVLGTIASAVAVSYWWLIAARAVVGFAAPATGIIAYAMIADLFAPAERGRATTVVVLGQLLGSSGAFFVGGYLLATLATDDGTPWRLALAIMAGLLMVPTLAALLIREPERTRGDQRVPVSTVWPELWRNRHLFLPLVAGMALVGLADGAALVWTAPTLARKLSLPPDQIGAMIGTILLAAGVLGPLLGGWLADRCQRRGGPSTTVAALAGLALLSFPFGLFPLMPTAGALGAALLVFLLLGPAISVMVTALTVIVMPDRVRGLCITIKYATGTLVGIGLAPVIVGFLATALPSPWGLSEALALTTCTTTLLGALVLLRFRRHFATAAATAR